MRSRLGAARGPSVPTIRCMKLIVRFLTRRELAVAGKWALHLGISLGLLCVIPLLFTTWQIASHEAASSPLVHFSGYVKTLFRLSLPSITFFSALVGVDIKSIPLKYSISIVAFAGVGVATFLVLRKWFQMASDRAAWLAVTVGVLTAQLMGAVTAIFI